MKRFLSMFAVLLVFTGIVLWQFDAFAVKTTVISFLSLYPHAAGFVFAAPFPITPKLISVVVAYKNPKGIADEVAPRTPVGSKAFKYKKYAAGDNITIPDTLVGRTSRPGIVNFGFIEDDSSCIDYGLDGLVPQDDIDSAPEGYDPEAHQAESVMDLILLDREKRVADTVFSVNTYAVANRLALAGNSMWSDYANSDPNKAILTACDDMAMRPNLIVFGQSVWTQYRQHPKVIKATNKNSGDAGIAAREAVAELLEMDKVLVGQSYHNSSKKGQAVTRSRLWGNYVSLIYQDRLASVNGDRITFMLTAQFKDRIAGSIEDKNIGLKGGKCVRVGEQVKELVTANDLGFIFSNVV